MTTQMCSDPKLMIAQHLEVLRGYAKRAFLQDGRFTPSEAEDQMRRIGEFFAMGHFVGLTEKELVGLLFRDLFVVKRGCGCPRCRAEEIQE